jgi:hypothetical protein
MKVPRVRFTIARLLTVVAVSALVLTPFAWSSPESRLPLLVMVVTAVGMLLIVASPFLLDQLEGGRTRLSPRGQRLQPLPRSRLWWQVIIWQPPPHQRGTPGQSTR